MKLLFFLKKKSDLQALIYTKNVQLLDPAPTHGISKKISALFGKKCPFYKLSDAPLIFLFRPSFASRNYKTKHILESTTLHQLFRQI